MGRQVLPPGSRKRRSATVPAAPAAARYPLILQAIFPVRGWPGPCCSACSNQCKGRPWSASHRKQPSIIPAPRHAVVREAGSAASSDSFAALVESSSIAVPTVVRPDQTARRAAPRADAPTRAAERSTPRDAPRIRRRNAPQAPQRRGARSRRCRRRRRADAADESRAKADGQIQCRADAKTDRSRQGGQDRRRSRIRAR